MPVLWVASFFRRLRRSRQASAFSFQVPACPILHGIEVDILKDGALDLPGALLEAADIVVASVHSNWSNDPRTNTDRILRAIETGNIDIIAHPTSAIVGKPGVPDYLRTPADLHWDEVFEKCALWQVAVEMNCFPSRLDLPLDLLRKAVLAGCTISFGSDAHARSHLLNLRFGEAAIRRLPPGRILNGLSYEQIRDWIRESRAKRRTLTTSVLTPLQATFPFESDTHSTGRVLMARVRPPQNIPAGARIVGIDLTAGDKPTGLAVLNNLSVETSSALSDDEILAYVSTHRPAIVSIDSPLGLPGGGDAIDPKAGTHRSRTQFNFLPGQRGNCFIRLVSDRGVDFSMVAKMVGALTMVFWPPVNHGAQGLQFPVGRVDGFREWVPLAHSNTNQECHLLLHFPSTLQY
jgi:histidinol phosphatase-like PHP family hydrolase